MVVAPVTFGTLIYGDSANTSPHKLFAISLLFTTVLIIIVVLLFKKKGQITNLDISEREQRVQPLVYGSIIYGVGFLVLNYFDATPLVKGLMFCYAINTAIVWMITRSWKISIHAIGLGGPIVALWMFGFHYPFLMAGAMILLCISRVILKAHTPAQVIAGAGMAMSFAYIELTLLFL
jgi:membrane-associated phospholipid phosphatase